MGHGRTGHQPARWWHPLDPKDSAVPLTALPLRPPTTGSSTSACVGPLRRPPSAPSPRRPCATCRPRCSTRCRAPGGRRRSCWARAPRRWAGAGAVGAATCGPWPGLSDLGATLLPRRWPMSVRECGVDECDKAVYARGLCGRHYKQQRRHGQVQPDQGPRPCAADGCGRQAVTRGWCHGHYLRWSRRGDVRADVPLHPTGVRRLQPRRVRSRSTQLRHVPLPLPPLSSGTATRCGVGPCGRSPARARSATGTGG